MVFFLFSLLGFDQLSAGVIGFLPQLIPIRVVFGDDLGVVPGVVIGIGVSCPDAVCVVVIFIGVT